MVVITYRLLLADFLCLLSFTLVLWTPFPMLSLALPAIPLNTTPLTVNNISVTIAKRRDPVTIWMTALPNPLLSTSMLWKIERVFNSTRGLMLWSVSLPCCIHMFSFLFPLLSISTADTCTIHMDYYAYLLLDCFTDSWLLHGSSMDHYHIVYILIFPFVLL